MQQVVPFRPPLPQVLEGGTQTFYTVFIGLLCGWFKDRCGALGLKDP